VRKESDAQRRPIYRGRVVDLVLETVELPNGETTELEIVRHPGGAAVVALDERDRVCLLRQYRHAAGGWLWELPAGKIDPGETPFSTARRELAEEAGVVSDDWADLGHMLSSPGVCTEVIYLYLARGLQAVAQNHETHEVIEIHWLPLRQVLDWCVDGTIEDSKTLIGLFRAEVWGRNRARLDVEDPGC
jgi:ADP-ribose pyrophosphatase